MIKRLRSYRNGVHGQFFLDAAAEMERLQVDNDELRESVAGYRKAILEMKTRTIVNTRHVQIFSEIRTIVGQVGELHTTPTAAVNTIITLLNIIEEEATTP